MNTVTIKTKKGKRVRVRVYPSLKDAMSDKRFRAWVILDSMECELTRIVVGL